MIKKKYDNKLICVYKSYLYANFYKVVYHYNGNIFQVEITKKHINEYFRYFAKIFIFNSNDGENHLVTDSNDFCISEKNFDMSNDDDLNKDKINLMVELSEDYIKKVFFK